MKILQKPRAAVMIIPPDRGGVLPAAITIRPVVVIGVDEAAREALCEQVFWKKAEKRIVSFSRLATSTEAAQKLLEIHLSAMLSRPLLSEVAGTTEGMAEASQP